MRGMHDCPECGKTVMHGNENRMCDECRSRFEDEEDDALPNVRTDSLRRGNGFGPCGGGR